LATRFRLLLTREIHDEMLAHALAEAPNECCGLLAGRIDGDVGRVERCLPLVNERASPTTYRSEPHSILAASRTIDRNGWVELAVYHSHPTSAAVPSRTDLAENFRGESVVHVIVTLTTTPPTVRGWWLLADRYEEAEWGIRDDP
jgi:[CysO sulfur-carrier protein]-S-L-cysteine hydrolase